jgi:hypothetical protein
MIPAALTFDPSRPIGAAGKRTVIARASEATRFHMSASIATGLVKQAAW